MTKRGSYVITGPDIDPETEGGLDSDGRRIDQAYGDEVVDRARAQASAATSSAINVSDSRRTSSSSSWA